MAYTNTLAIIPYLDRPNLAVNISQMFRSSGDKALLLIIYRIGVASILIVPVLMYGHALKNSVRLEFNRVE
jgi:hypothetical protein